LGGIQIDVLAMAVRVGKVLSEDIIPVPKRPGGRWARMMIWRR